MFVMLTTELSPSTVSREQSNTIILYGNCCLQTVLSADFLLTNSRYFCQT